MIAQKCLKRRRPFSDGFKFPFIALFFCSVLLPYFGSLGVVGFYLLPLRKISQRIPFTVKECGNNILTVYSSRENDARTWTQQRSTGSPSSTSSATNDLSSHLTPFIRPPNRSESQSSRIYSKSSSNPQRRQKMKPMPVTGYDARAIEDYYDMRPLEVGWRLNSLGFPLLGKCFYSKC